MTARLRPRALVDIGEIARMLDARAETLVRELLPDGRRQGHEWVARCPWHAHKNLGSFSVHLTGAKAGLWKEFGAGESGDGLDLVAMTLFGGDKKQALVWARRWLGLETGDPNALERVRRATPSAETMDAAGQEERRAVRNLAWRLWLGAAKDLRDTPVDRYLLGRGISLHELGRAPRAIRYHPALHHKPSDRKWPAMITMIAAGDGAFAGAHRTYLEVQADGRVRKAPVAMPKMTLGSWAGGCIRLWRGASGTSLKDAAPGEIVNITEGIEDGLSVAMALPDERVIAAISLANMGGVVLPDNIAGVRLWKQNDKHPETIRQFERAARMHVDAGREVHIPQIPDDLKDVNDLIQADQPR